MGALESLDRLETITALNGSRGSKARALIGFPYTGLQAPSFYVYIAP